MTNHEKRFVVVLGMHRSGTSAVTRALQVLGVDLGSRLIEGAEGNNEKGFFEDIDINAFDSELLGALGREWHTLAPLENEDLTGSVAQAFKLQAVELLRSKMDAGNSLAFGLKDPRISILLPFWQRIFEHLDVKPRYVLTCRNPMSVARSLQARDQFDLAKGYHLWLDHTVSCIALTASAPRVVVDYDDLIADPAGTLARISSMAGLPFDTASRAFHEYAAEFLESRLRHSRFHASDLILEKSMPVAVVELYSVLKDVSSGKASLEDSAVSATINRLLGWQAEMRPTLRFLRVLDEKATRLAASVRDQAARIEDLDADIIARNASIAGLRESVAERDRWIVERDAHIRELERISALRDEEIAILTRTLNERDRIIGERDAHVIALQTRITEILSSNSWKVTAPLRRSRDLVRALGRALSRWAPLSRTGQYIYRWTPLPRGFKSGIKDWLFLRMGRTLSGLKAYREWEDFHRHRRTLSSVNLSSNQPRTLDDNVTPWSPSDDGRDSTREGSMTTGKPGSIHGLPVADGRWEWEDYDVVLERLCRAKQAIPSPVEVKPWPILDLKETEITSVIKSLEFVQHADPVVSIVIPTFNNLKLTVECLASIKAHESQTPYEIIIADDASVDGSAARLREIKGVAVLESPSNQNFLRNVNRTLDSIRGRFVILLNNDVQVTHGWLDALVSTAIGHEGIGAVGSKIVYPSGHLQEAGVSFRRDCTAEMVGLNEPPSLPVYSYLREVDYCSGACLLVDAALFRSLGGFDDAFAPAYCEDGDLCLRIRQRGRRIVFEPTSVVIHHLSKTMAADKPDAKLALIARNLVTFSRKWQSTIDELTDVRLIAFYLPQYHPIPENDRWWGKGFTEWTNVAKARPNFVGHYQPRLPADLGYYDLRIPEVMEQQARLARRYGIYGFCYYYYWFGGKRLLEMPLERVLAVGKPDFPFCLCWANENWTRRWDGQDQQILMGQAHSDADDTAVINDLSRYFRSKNYIRINGKPLLIVYRVNIFPNFLQTAQRWRRICREEGIGEIYLAMVESFDLVSAQFNPAEFGCDAAIEFPPQGMAEERNPSGRLLNKQFKGTVADYRDLAVRFALREQPSYVRFRGVMPGWDNTARRQNDSFSFESATPGAFQAWLEFAIDQTRTLRTGPERMVFVNAWNEWAEGAYVEPDRRFGHAFLEAVRNARDAGGLKRRNAYALG